MNKFFRLYDYLANMKSRINKFNLRGKTYIWWEDVKNVIGIHEDELTQNEFEKVLREKYLSERYYDDMADEFYERKMGSMADEEYANRLLELLIYVLYLKEEKAKIQRFISGLPVAFKDKIEFHEPRSLEESIRKLKHCYEQSKRRSETRQDWKGNDKNKGKCDNKKTRPQAKGKKENIALPKKFNASDRGHGFWFEE